MKQTLRKGYALATILILLGVAMFGAGAIVTISTLESKISRSQQEGIAAYYAAEAGVQDALWHLNNDTGIADNLSNGNLNYSYSVSNKPVAGQSFSVSMVTTAQGAGYGRIEVTGSSDTGTFVATRKIEVNVFRGASTAATPIGQNAYFIGGSLSLTNGAAAITVTGGNIYTSGSMSITSATLNAGTNTINAVGAYNANPSSNVTSGGIFASNRPPAPTSIASPTFNFSYYSTHYNNRYTPSQFQNLVSNGGSTINLPGPVTYISGSVSFGTWARNKTINANGLLIFNGSVSVGSSVQNNFRLNITDPGNGRSGLFALTSMSISRGTYDIDGVMYTSGSMSITNSQTMNIDGALVTGGAISMNAGQAINVNFNATRINQTLDGTLIGGGGPPQTVEVQHWEEQY